MFCNMEGEACTNFVDSKDGRCQFIEKTDQSLVRGSPSSKKSLKVWTKETIETGFVFNSRVLLLRQLCKRQLQYKKANIAGSLKKTSGNS